MDKNKTIYVVQLWYKKNIKCWKWEILLFHQKNDLKLNWMAVTYLKKVETLPCLSCAASSEYMLLWNVQIHFSIDGAFSDIQDASLIGVRRGKLLRWALTTSCRSAEQFAIFPQAIQNELWLWGYVSVSGSCNQLQPNFSNEGVSFW